MTNWLYRALGSACDQPPDLVLSNVVMSDVDGVELTRWLRANPPTATVPIILLSADNRMDAVQRGAGSQRERLAAQTFLNR